MEKVETLTFKKKEEKISHIADNYFYLKNKKKEKAFSSSDSQDDTSFDLSYVERVNYAFSCLTPIEQTIINNDFFYQDYSGWWEKIFNRRSYWNKKDKAMTHFLKEFYAY